MRDDQSSIESKRVYLSVDVVPLRPPTAPLLVILLCAC